MELSWSDPRGLGRNLFQLLLYASQVSHGMAWERLRASEVRSCWLSAWAPAHPLKTKTPQLCLKIQSMLRKTVLWKIICSGCIRKWPQCLWSKCPVFACRGWGRPQKSSLNMWMYGCR